MKKSTIGLLAGATFVTGMAVTAFVIHQNDDLWFYYNDKADDYKYKMKKGKKRAAHKFNKMKKQTKKELEEIKSEIDSRITEIEEELE